MSRRVQSLRMWSKESKRTLLGVFDWPEFPQAQ